MWVVFLFGATLVWMSGTDMFLGSMLLVMLGGWGLVAALGLYVLVGARDGRLRRFLPQNGVAWVACLIVLVLAVGLGLAGIPEKVRVRLSRDALIHAGERVLAGEHPTRAGLYGFERTSVMEGCAILETGGFVIDIFGFAYCPPGTSAEASLDHVEGPLYTFSWD